MKNYYLFIFLLAALHIHCIDVQASNRVKIVTIGGGFQAISAGDDRNNPQRLVDRMIEYWKREINKALVYQPDLILLTEVCDDPGGLNRQERSEYYRIRKNQVQDFFASVAKENRCYIAFGTQREENSGVWRNSCVVLDREGKMAGVYNKNYPVIGEMNGGIIPGTEAPLIQCDFGTVGCAICFDLNFDELRDRYAVLKPDVLLFVSQWHGGLEQTKWAYSCRSFFVCSYSFRTQPVEIRNPFGNVVAASTHNHNYAVATVNLDKQLIHQDLNLGKIIELKRKYGDRVTITEQGDIGVLMITSEHEQVSSAEMVKEFGIELLDDYLERSVQARLQKLRAN